MVTVQHIPFTAPLVGRTEELARLTAVLDRARSGEPRAVLVSGDAGVGKTRLLDEAAVRAAGAGTTVLTGHCVDLGDVGLPYLPFTEILGRIAADERFAAVRAAHPVVERLLGGAPEEVRDSGGRLRLFEGVAGLLAAVADVAPLLLIVEDLHWADQSSRDLLRFLLSRGVLQGTGAPRLAVLASYRSDDLHRRHPLRPVLAELVRLPVVERLELRPLPEAEVSRLVRALEETPLPEETVRGIVARAEGQRLLRAGAARGGRLGGGRAAERAGGRAADPGGAAVGDRSACGAYGGRGGPAGGARPAAGGAGAAGGGAGVGAAGGRGAAGAGGGRRRHVHVPARAGAGGGVRGSAAG
ncbi:hypothetical protein GCM10020256_71940 [Streptomyces thermocoprophilus]